MKAVKITTDGQKSVVEFTNETCYETLSEAVGGYIECVSLYDKPGAPDMWVNEEGKLDGLDQNPIATALWVDMYSTTDVMAGNVIITGGADEEGYTQGLTDDQVEFFLKYDKIIWNTAMPGFLSFA